MVVWNLSYKLCWFHWSSKTHTLAILGGTDECMFSRSKKNHVCSTLMASGRLGLILESSFSSGSSTRAPGHRRPQKLSHVRKGWRSWGPFAGGRVREQERHRSLNSWQCSVGKGLDLIYVAREYGTKNQWLEVMGRKNPASIEGGTSKND